MREELLTVHGTIKTDRLIVFYKILKEKRSREGKKCEGITRRIDELQKIELRKHLRKKYGVTNV